MEPDHETVCNVVVAMMLLNRKTYLRKDIKKDSFHVFVRSDMHQKISRELERAKAEGEMKSGWAELRSLEDSPESFEKLYAFVPQFDKLMYEKNLAKSSFPCLYALWDRCLIETLTLATFGNSEFIKKVRDEYQKQGSGAKFLSIHGKLMAESSHVPFYLHFKKYTRMLLNAFIHEAKKDQNKIKTSTDDVDKWLSLMMDILNGRLIASVQHEHRITEERRAAHVEPARESVAPAHAGSAVPVHDPAAPASASAAPAEPAHDPAAPASAGAAPPTTNFRDEVVEFLIATLIET